MNKNKLYLCYFKERFEDILLSHYKDALRRVRKMAAT